MDSLDNTYIAGKRTNDLHSLPNIVQVIKSIMMRWVGNVARMGESRGLYGVLVGKSKGKNHLEDPGVDGKIILRWIFRMWGVWIWNGWSWLKDRERWRTLVNVVMNLRVP